MSRTPTSGIDYTSRDYEGFRQAMLAELGMKMPEYTDRSQTDAGIVILELNAKGLDILSYYADIIANETLLPTCKRRDSTRAWCTILSYTPRMATPSRIKQVFVLSGVQETDTIIPAGTYVKTNQSAAEQEVIFETEKDLVIPAGKLGNETDSYGNYLYTVSAVQGTSVEGELVGSSDGTASQQFKLTYSPVIRDSVELLVNEGSGFEPWVRVDNFVDSGPSSKHYVLSITNDDEALIQFGDGTLGKIPSKFDSSIYANYRVGGGTQGNVGANKVVVMETNLAVVDSTFNPEGAYEYGQDKETVEEIKVNAPRYSEVKWGALTLQDFADVVLLNFPEVIFANSERDSGDIDSIHIYLLTKDGATVSSTLKAEIDSFFDENEGGRKIVGANNIYVEPATMVAKNLTATLIVKDRYSRATVSAQIRACIEDYFAVGNYPFNKELSLSELAAYVMNPDNAIQGIKSFYFTSPTDAVITPTAKQIFSLGTLTINASGGEA